MKNELFANLQKAILLQEEDLAEKIAQNIIETGKESALIALREVLPDVSKIVGEKFETGEYFLPQLVIAGEIMVKVSKILESGISIDVEKVSKKIIVIGTVQGDVHTIGKNIVKIMLKTAGFEVIDIGEDVKAETFVNKAEEHHADIIAASCLMTMTLPYQKEIIEELNDRGLRKKYKVLVGGGPVDQAWADKIGADGFGADGIQAAKVAKQLISK